MKPITPAVSRRSFMRLAGVAASMPIFTEAHFAYAFQTSAAAAPAVPRKRFAMEGAAARRDSDQRNENPLGPCKAACEAIGAIAHKGGRYDIDVRDQQADQGPSPRRMASRKTILPCTPALPSRCTYQCWRLRRRRRDL